MVRLPHILLKLLLAVSGGAAALAQTPIPISGASVTGSEILTVTISGTVYGRNRMVPGNVTAFAGASAGVVLLRGGTEPPPTGSRGTLTGDWYLDTGIINPGIAAEAMTITFSEPIVNRAGPDIVLFEINAGTVADSCNVQINGVTVAVPTTVGAGGWGSTGYAVTSADVYSTSTTPATLSAVENGTLTLTSADVNQTVFGVAFDLSQFGVADGASVSSLTIWSTSTGSAVDPVLVAGLITPPEQTGGPVIEELMANNKETLQDEDLEYPDWVEIYNGTGAAADLTGWRLSDDPALPAKWIFPAITLPAYGHTYVFCSGKNKFTGAHPHANFKLKKEGGAVVLTRPDGSTATNIAYPAQVDDISYGALGAAQTLGYLETPTPGSANAGRQAAGPPCPDPVFDRLSGPITAATTLAISLPVTPPAGAVIRYLLDNNAPSETSPLYSAPINVTASTTVAARVFAPGRLPSRNNHGSFQWLASDIATNFNASGAPFSSNLPILVLDSYVVNIDGTTDPNSVRPGRFTQVAVYDVNPATGRASLGETPALISRAGMHVRGQSSSGYPQRPYALEFWGEYVDDDKKVALLGMPAESDWVLQTVVTDKTFMRNYTMQQLMLLENGPYAGRRCRFVEVFFNQDNSTSTYGTGTSGDFRGTYLLIESIKRGTDRVDVQKLNAEMTDPALISGGFIYKKDKTPYQAPITLNSGLVYDINDPTPTAAQSNALKTYLNQTDTALAAGDFAVPASGNYYGKWVDWRSLIERQIWQETCKEVDSYIFSYYYSKDRGQPLRAFPFWDVDRSLGNSNYGTADNALGFRWWTAGSGYVYFSRLFVDPEFSQAYWDRWWRLRQGTFATAALMARIEATAAQLTTNALNQVTDAAIVTNTSASSSAATQSPAARHFKRWATLGTSSYGSGPVGQPDRNSYRKELDLMKAFLTYRLDWFDAMSPAGLRPVELFNAGTGIANFGGAVPPGYQAAIVNPNDATGTIYYTVNGADPRATGGGISGGVQSIAAGALPFTTLVASSGSGWKYFTQGSEPAGTWNTTAFDDSAWTTAIAPIGYGETGMNTNLATAVTTTMYFRKSFNVTNAATITGLQLELMHDDGALVFLNGSEVARAGMPYPPTAITFATTATGAVDDSRGETAYHFIRLDPTKLVEGANVLAIQIHQAAAPPTIDMRIDARLKASRAATLGTPLQFNSSGTYTVRSRLLSGGNWSPLTVATFVVDATPATAANIVISELHYQPANPSTAETNAGYQQKDFEFIELLNVGGGYVDLAGSRFSDGVSFTFPASDPALTVLAPGGRIVVAANVNAFRMRYPALPAVRVAGPYAGNLDNLGERVTLLSAAATIIAQFTYAPAEPWPVDAAGPGYSLVLNNAAPNLTSAYYNSPANWRTSATPGGVPGQAKSVVFTGLPDGDTDGDGLRDWLEYATGSSFTDPTSRHQPVSTLAPFTVGGITQTYLKFEFRRNLLADEVTLTPEWSEDLAAWSGVTGAVTYVSTRNNADGTATITCRSTQPADATRPRQFIRLRAQ